MFVPGEGMSLGSLPKRPEGAKWAPGLEVIEEAGVTSRAPFPYVPGLLTFREAPALLEAWAQLRTEPAATSRENA